METSALKNENIDLAFSKLASSKFITSFLIYAMLYRNL